VFVDRLLQLRWLVGRNCQELHVQILQLRLDLAQLNHLLVAVRSPTATIEDENRRLLPDGAAQIEGLVIHGP
jgi:hypothetical protein